MQEISTFLANHASLSIAALILIFLLIIVEVIRMRRNIFNINTTQATQLINRENAVIIDIRSTEAYKSGHIIDSLSLNPADIIPNSKKIEKYKKRPLILVCEQGIGSQKTAALLLKHGYNAFSLAGGIRSWVSAQLPLVKE